MTDDQHDQHEEGTPRSAGRWDPLPQGDYDDGATAFVKLPEGGVDALLSSADSPLAAPGQGYVPPQITVTPNSTGETDPAATGSWAMPAAPGEGVQWPDPNAMPQDVGNDRFTYEPGATGQWNFEETRSTAPESAPAAPAPGHDVTGQWSIPVAGGDLPDESGEFTTSSLVEQWGGTPPATLPGGAPAPWATEAAGRPWGQEQPGASEQTTGPGYEQPPPGPAGQTVDDPTATGYEPGRGAGHGHDRSAGPGYEAEQSGPSGHAREQSAGSGYDTGQVHGQSAGPGGTREQPAGTGYDAGRPAGAEHLHGQSQSPGAREQPAGAGYETEQSASSGRTREQPAGTGYDAGRAAGAGQVHGQSAGSGGTREQSAGTGYDAGRPAGAERAHERAGETGLAYEQSADGGQAYEQSAGGGHAHGQTAFAGRPGHEQSAPTRPGHEQSAPTRSAHEQPGAHTDAPPVGHAPERHHMPGQQPASEAHAPVQASPPVGHDPEQPHSHMPGQPQPHAAEQPQPHASQRPAKPYAERPAEAAVAAAQRAHGADDAEEAPEGAEAAEEAAEPGSAEAAAEAATDPETDAEAEAEAPDGTAPPPSGEEHPLASYVLRVNGVERPVTDAWIGESLLYVLRERLGLAGAKDGCSQGECGACNVQVDGRLVASCLVPAVTAAGSEVRTVEGLAVDGQPSDVQRALARCGAVQCGFCVPGMAMTVHDLLEGNPAPTEMETRQALCGNLCRCSGYRGVVDAVQEVVAEREAHSAAGDSEHEGDEARIPHQAGPGAGGVNPSAFEPATPRDRTHDQAFGQGQDGGQA
ncbi:2Fe-2S iron-sulfur cluster-binding protein [Streptomyces sp. NPDC050619]|uniref:2Fe-2S iron-sulfur cluster-binding protein n=1 Tax=Streptomyces sp. NPDC050619 TaxID=3157214 RepID=UPI003424E7BA